jgi:hypothetical protein
MDSGLLPASTLTCTAAVLHIINVPYGPILAKRDSIAQ